MSQTENKPCMACKKVCFPNSKGQLKSRLYDQGGTVLSTVNPRPNSKFHFNIITKRHTEDLRTLTNQEWEDILPVLKKSIAKVEDRLKWDNKPCPIGYNISIPNGELAAQNMPQHFYMRVVPKYRKNFGLTMFPHTIKYARSQDFVENKGKVWAALQSNQDKIVVENSKFIVKLHEDDGKEMPNVTRESLVGMLAISTKNHLPNDINAIDPET